MKRREWFSRATKDLGKAGIATARLDALVLLEDVLEEDRTYILAHDTVELTREHLSVLNKQIERRIQHEPLAYIRGKTEFYGREFYVSKDTLEPRPETETIIELVKGLQLPAQTKIADVGAGSGAIGITLALELPDVEMAMYEINEAAIKIAEQNIKKLKARNCHIYKNDLLKGITAGYDIVVANLPYVPDKHTINKAAMQEPKIAIFGGPDGLNLYRRLFLQIAEHSQPPRYILAESLPFQHQDLSKIAQDAGYNTIDTDDFIQLFRRL